MALPICWVITDGKAGMESQCVGLAETLGLVPVIKRTRLRSPWRQLSPTILRNAPLRALSQRGDGLAPPWPDLLIATGRQSVLPSLLVDRESGGRAFRVQIQNPTIDPKRFDLVVVPRHDRLRGDNVIVTRGALHRVNATRLEAARAHFAPRLGVLSHPRVAVLIGGDNDVFRLTPEIMSRLADQLAVLAKGGTALMVTPSRRTGPANEAFLRDRLAGVTGEVWDGTGENPYYGYLAHADAIIVTEDSVNMITEASATGKPVHLVSLQGGSAKFRRFRSALDEDGVARPFTGTIENWTYPVADDMEAVARAVRERLERRGLQFPCRTAAPST